MGRDDGECRGGDPQAEGYNTKDGIAVAVAQLKAHGMAPRKLAEGAKL